MVTEALTSCYTGYAADLYRDLDRNEPPETREKALKHVTIFKQWALTNLFAVTEDGSSSTVILVPHGRPGANYRDRKPDKSPPPAVNPITTNTIIGGAQLLVPSKRLEVKPYYGLLLTLSSWTESIRVQRVRADRICSHFHQHRRRSR